MRRQWRLCLRLARFAAVGATCFALQAGILTVLERAGVPATLANAVGFAASAQLNFLLSSYFTWFDRRVPLSARRTVAARWAAFQATAGLALCFNTGVFALAVRVLDPVAAAAVGVLTGAALTFMTGNHLIFRNRRTRTEPIRDSQGENLDAHRPEPARVGAARGTDAD